MLTGLGFCYSVMLIIIEDLLLVLDTELDKTNKILHLIPGVREKNDKAQSNR